VQDPILNKLKTDAGIVLTDLWRAIRHQPPVEAEEWLHPRMSPGRPEMDSPQGERPAPSGLCYFHLN
jgi:hypothetical protein